ncbi:TPA: hypothetical protein ACJ5RM_001510 [Acinetobacter baumannii]
MENKEYETFLKWHFDNWKFNCAHSDSVDEAKKIYERIYQNDKPIHVAERERGFMAWKAGKAQAVPDTHTHSVTLTCAELKEAYDFGAPDGEKDQFQMETEMTIKWLEDGYDGPGYYCWYADLPEEGCIKLGKSESGAKQ